MTNTVNLAKRLPVIFCLDVSPSMNWKENGYRAIDLLNSSVRKFIADIKEDAATKASVEVAFVTFSTDYTDFIGKDEFLRADSMKLPKIKTVRKGGTQLGKAILHCIDRLDDRMQELLDLTIGYYTPFIVIITDGSPDQNDDEELFEQAVTKLKERSEIKNKQIIPFVIGVGERINSDCLNRLASIFTDGYFAVNGKNAQADFSKVFDLLLRSSKTGVSRAQKDGFSIIQKDMKKVFEELKNKG